MNVVKATRQFEQWLGHRTDLIPKDLRLKHTNMRAAGPYATHWPSREKLGLIAETPERNGVNCLEFMS